MFMKSVFHFAVLAGLAALQGCGTASPRAIVPEPDSPVLVSVQDAVFVASAGTDAYTCATWAATKLWLAPESFADAVTRTLSLGKANLTPDENSARYVLSFRFAGNAIYYELTDSMTKEPVWYSDESWPGYAKGCTLCCDDEAQAHLLRFLKSFAAWDGTPIKRVAVEAVDIRDAAAAAAIERTSRIDRILQASNPQSAVGLLAESLKNRYAAGEQPPSELTDPNYQLVNCTGLDAEAERRPGYIAIGWDDPTIACENTVAGQELLALRRWQCREQPTRACTCGQRSKDDFWYFLDHPMFAPTSIYESGSMVLGPSWNIYSVDSDTLETAFLPLRFKLMASSCTFEGS